MVRVFWGSGALQCGLTVGYLDREVDPAINELAEVLKVGEEGLDVSEFLGADVAGKATHVMRVAELPKGSGLFDRISGIVG